MYICMYVCMYVRMYVCIYVCIYVCNVCVCVGIYNYFSDKCVLITFCYIH